MAITISQQPTSPNAAYTDLIYVVTGSVSSSQPQFRYVLDIYESGSSDILERLTAVPNSTGTAEFNINRIVQANVPYDQNFKAHGISGSLSYKDFEIKVGDSYGASISSSVTIYPNQVTSSIGIIPAVNEIYRSGNYNWPSSSYLYPWPSSSYNPNTRNIALTNQPFVDSINDQDFRVYGGETDYATVSFFQTGFDAFKSGSLGTVSVSLHAYDEGLVWRQNIFSDLLQTGSVYNDNQVLTIGVGLGNYLNTTGSLTYGSTSSLQEALEAYPSWSYFLTNIDISGSSGNSIQYYTANENRVYDNPLGINGIGINQTFNTGSFAYKRSIQFYNRTRRRYGGDLHDNKTRFAFINRLGFYDYFTLYAPVGRRSTPQREIVSLPTVDYSSATSTYDITRGGDDSYYSSVDDSFDIVTHALSQQEATYLEELIESPSVYIQKGTAMVPINITNASYEALTNINRQKSFNYTITFEPASGDWSDYYDEEVHSKPIWYYLLTACSGSETTEIRSYNSLKENSVVGYTSGSVECWTVTAWLPGPLGTNNPVPLFTGSCYDNCEDCGQFVSYYNIQACEDYTVTQSIFSDSVALQVGDVIEYISGSYQCWSVVSQTSVPNNNYWTSSIFADCVSCGEFSRYYVAEACDNSSYTASFRTVNFSGSIGDVVKLNEGGYECFTITSVGNLNTSSYVGALYEDCQICADADNFYQAAACLDDSFKLNIYTSSSFETLQTGDVINYPSGITASAPGTPYDGEELTCWTITDAAAISSSAVFFTGSVYQSTGSNPCQECGQYYAYLSLQSCDDPGVFRSVYWDDDITAGTVLYFSGSGAYEGYDCWTVYGTTTENNTYLGATTQSFANCASCSLYTP